MPAPDPRPHILLVMTDQFRGDALSIERHPVVLTPNIDEVGARGARFVRAYSTCPSCIAARRALLTGLHPAATGMVGYQPGLPIGTPTLPGLLRDGGYATALAGRHMHQSPYEEPYGYDRQNLGSTYIEGDDYARYLEASAPGAGGIRGTGASFNGWNARPWPHAEHLHPTNWTARQARALVAERNRARPLFLTASFFAPHPPLIPPAFYFERYLRAGLPMPAIGDWAARPADDGLGAGIDANRCVLQGEALRCAQAGYFGLINHLDDQLYWLLTEFREAAQTDRRPLLIVVTSDHGEMLGDHYYFRKCEPYEGSTRIPLLIEASGVPGCRPRTVGAGPVCLEDVMPTMLEAAGIAAPEGIDGRSLLPVMRGDADGVRDILHSEHAPAYGPDQAYHSLTDGRTRYIWRPHTGAEQLFDLAADPTELHDLAPVASAHPALRQWRDRMAAHLAGRPEGFSHGGVLIAGRPYHNIVRPHGA